MTTPLQLASIWEKISGLLKSRISAETYSSWFKEVKLVEMSQTDLVFEVENDITAVWIETNYKELLQEVSLLVLDQVLNIEIRNAAAVAPQPESKKSSSGSKSGANKDQAGRSKANANINPKYRFNNFVVGHNSQFAYASAEAVANAPCSVYNPLFIHGGSGLGKTHLMQAIGNTVSEKFGEQSVQYLTCEQFTNEFIDAIQHQQLSKFRNKYRRVRVLLLDDVQFFGGKERSQEEFFHTFNSLFDTQKQIILTSDRPACEIAQLEPRLVSRFESGLTVEINPPSLETRVAILQQKRSDWNVNIGDEILHFLAANIRKNVRRLEGSLMRLATFSSLSGSDPSLEKAQHLLRDILREEQRKTVTIESIQRFVAEHFSIRLADMTSKRRPANIAFPRQIAMYLSRRMTSSSLMDIGEAFGGRDHGTVIHAAKSIEAKMEADPGLHSLIEQLDEQLRS